MKKFKVGEKVTFNTRMTTASYVIEQARNKDGCNEIKLKGLGGWFDAKDIKYV